MQLYKIKAFEIVDKLICLIVCKGKNTKVLTLLFSLYDDCKAMQSDKERKKDS